MAVESPKCWQRGVVRLVERLPGQGARAGCAQDGHTRPRTHVAVALARSGPPASTASEASRGPFLVRFQGGYMSSQFRGDVRNGSEKQISKVLFNINVQVGHVKAQ